VATSKLVKWGAAGFVLSGVLLIVLTSAAVFTGLLADLVLSAGLIYFYIYLVLTGIVSQLLLGLGVVGLHALQKGRYGSLGLTGFYTILVALAVRILAEVVALANPQAIPWLRSPVGLLVLIVGFVLYGLASLQARMLPRWYSVLLIIFVPVSYVMGRLGLLPDIWFGAALLVLGFVLWQQGEALAEQPAPVA
jgi:hypothetical protein